MKTIRLTDEQADLLTFYILITTKYREGEIEACSKLGRELKSDGSTLFPRMAANAEWWTGTNHELERIRRIIDGAPHAVEDVAAVETRRLTRE